MAKNWIQSFSNKVVDPRDVKSGDLSIEDVAHALSMKCRFTGHCKKLYTVAEHCCRGSQLVAPSFALAFLLHEVSEVALPDVAKPLKPFVWVTMPDSVQISWTHLETLHAEAIFKGLGLESVLPLIYSPEVKRADQQMLAWEQRDLMGPTPADWWLEEKPPYDEGKRLGQFPMDCWDPTKAESTFLARFKHLTRVETGC